MSQMQARETLRRGAPLSPLVVMTEKEDKSGLLVDPTCGGVFWHVTARISETGEIRKFHVQSWPGKDKDYIRSVIMHFHPEYSSLRIQNVNRPKWLGHAFNDPDEAVEFRGFK